MALPRVSSAFLLFVTMRGVNRVAEFRNGVSAARKTGHEKPSWEATGSLPPHELDDIVQQAFDVLLRLRDHDGRIQGIGWWQLANAYTAMALMEVWSGRRRHNYETLDGIFRQCERSHRRSDFINEFIDDTLWWAMCCMHMYSIASDDWYLQRAKVIWRHIRDSGRVCRRGQVLFSGDDMEGAVYWTTRPGESHINAISTSLYAELSARLALVENSKVAEAQNGVDHVPVDEYIETARCCLGWLLRCRYRPREGTVLDHIDLRTQKTVDWTFTYNTGVTLGVCALLYEATGEVEYMTLACHMAQKAMTRRQWVADNGVLIEHGRKNHDPLKNNDAVGFKSVLVRQLALLYSLISRTGCQLPTAVRTRGMIKSSVNINFTSQLERNTDGQGHYGPWWNGPFEAPTPHSQMAVLDVMSAAVLVNAT